ncbi:MULTISPECIES: hypothetical protein [unclassified Streptomyces]|uniref:hypothetical protein n=1 Tax=unclassified Streptomyces TaxID=2593676 RepID=UPI00379ED480
MTWVEFPFPACPACSRAWSASRHRDCPAGGGGDAALDVDPASARVRCAACRGTWSVWETRFHCSCGRRFEASEVEAALQEIIRVATLLVEILVQQSRDLVEIRRAGEASFRAWLGHLTDALAGALGAAAGRVVGSLVRSLF